MKVSMLFDVAHDSLKSKFEEMIQDLKAIASVLGKDMTNIVTC